MASGSGMISNHLQMGFRILFIIGLISVAALSLLPQETLPDIQIWDKWQHLAAYAALAFTGCGASANRQGMWWMIAGVIVYGAVLEIAQTFIPGRAGSFADLAANCIGVALGAGSLWFFRRIRTVQALRRF